MIAKTPDLEREERLAKLRKLLRSGGGWTARELWLRLGAQGDVPALERLLGELAEAGEANVRDGRWYEGPGAATPLMRVEPPRPKVRSEVERGAERLAPKTALGGPRPPVPGRMVNGVFVVGAKAQDDGAAGEGAGASVPLSGSVPELPAATRTEGEGGGTAAPSAAHTDTDTDDEDPDAALAAAAGASVSEAVRPAAPTPSEGSSNGRTAAGSPARADAERDAGSSPAPSTLSGRVIEILRHSPGLTVGEVNEALAIPGRPNSRTSQVLLDLERRCKVKRRGKSRPFRWYLVSPGGPGEPSARASAEARGFSAEPAIAGASKEAGTRPERQQTGFDKAPSHYDGGNGLEAIDRIWRLLRTIRDDDAMVAFCVGNALKYEMRAGKKTDGDADKARWYWQFATYVRGEGPDPRTARPGWVPHPDAPRPHHRSR